MGVGTGDDVRGDQGGAAAGGSAAVAQGEPGDAQ